MLLGIAAVADSPLLILDEPSVGLDPEARRDLWELLRSYRQRGKTVLLSTHYMEEAEALCSRVGIIQARFVASARHRRERLYAAYGYDYKITFATADGSETIYGNDDRLLVRQVQERGIDQYSVSRTTLEDVYLGLIEGVDRLSSAAPDIRELRPMGPAQVPVADVVSIFQINAIPAIKHWYVTVLAAALIPVPWFYVTRTIAPGGSRRCCAA